MTHPSVLILGTDAVVAAAPATPVQLTHASLRAGFSAVVPASWGDELIAARAIERVRATEGPLVQCSCPLVARRLAPNADVLAPMVYASVAPPVATALYVRALYAPRVVEITFAGACPSGADPSIDVRIPCVELLETLKARGIDVHTEPTEFDAVLPPDRRRFYSEPGGIPSRTALRTHVPTADFVELGHENFAVDLAQHLLSSSRTLISLAPALGCFCSGGQSGSSTAQGRGRARDHEPPRAPSEVVQHDLPLPLDRSVADSPFPSGTDAVGIAASSYVPAPASESVASDDGRAAPQPDGPVVALEDARRRSPASASRAVIGAMPQARAAGRQLPRAYVARRRSSPKGMRQSAVRRADPVAVRGLARWKRAAWIAGAGAGLFLVLRLFF